jgi:thiamine-phosphate pyrophosphorylase
VTICLVTDRRRTDPVSQARWAVDAGIDLFQIRERDLDAAPLAALVRAVLDITRGSRTRVVVNDRMDVAMACAADGVHLRGDSISPAAARQLARDRFLIGRSIHTLEDVSASDGADYLIAGTAFPTSSKPAETASLGEEGIRRLARAARLPVLAIGGVSLENAAAIARAGAAGIAAIGLFATPERLGEVVQQLRVRFDTAKTAP